MNKPKAILIGAVALLVLIVVLQNTESVDTRLLFVTVSMPRAALLFSTLLIGYGLGLLTLTLRAKKSA